MCGADAKVLLETGNLVGLELSEGVGEAREIEEEEERRAGGGG